MLSTQCSHGLCSLDVHSLIREVGIYQDTLQVDASQGIIIIVLGEEEERQEDGEVESDLVLLTKRYWN